VNIASVPQSKNYAKGVRAGGFINEHIDQNGLGGESTIAHCKVRKGADRKINCHSGIGSGASLAHKSSRQPHGAPRFSSHRGIVAGQDYDDRRIDGYQSS
jgi:hypothetical protein